MVTRTSINIISQKLALLVMMLVLLFTFNYGEVFDRVYVVVLITSFFIFKGPNTKGILSILLLERLLDEAVFYASEMSELTIFIYIMSFVVLFICKYDRLSQSILAPTLIISVLFEINWYLVEYDAPQIHFYTGLVAINTYVRHLIWQRFMTYDTESTRLDLQYFRLSAAYMVVTSIMVLEYLVRHSTGYELMVVYDYYGYIQHALSVIAIYMVLTELKTQQ